MSCRGSIQSENQFGTATRVAAIGSTPLMLLAVMVLATASGVMASTTRSGAIRPQAMTTLTLTALRTVSVDADLGTPRAPEAMAPRWSMVVIEWCEVARLAVEHLDLPPPAA